MSLFMASHNCSGARSCSCGVSGFGVNFQMPAGRTGPAHGLAKEQPQGTDLSRMTRVELNERWLSMDCGKPSLAGLDST